MPPCIRETKNWLKAGAWVSGLLGVWAWLSHRERRSREAQRVETAAQARRTLLALAQDTGNALKAADPRLASLVTVIVTACDRPCCIARFVASVRRFYPALPVLVCDNSRQPLFPHDTRVSPGVRWLHPADTLHSVGAGRNQALAHVETPYFFLADDDHVFTAATDVPRMLDFLERSGFDIVAGAQGCRDYGTAVFEHQGDLAVARFWRHRGRVGPGTVACDRVSNTFLARTRAVRRVGGWEARAFANEHAEFFFRCYRVGLRVAQMAGVWVDHDRTCEQAFGLGRLLPGVLPHPDFDYARKRNGANRWGIRSRRVRALERRWCWEKNGVRAIVNRGKAADRSAFMAAMLELESDLP